MPLDRGRCARRRGRRPIAAEEAIAFLDDDTFLGAENHCNLFTARKRADAATDDGSRDDGFGPRAFRPASMQPSD